MALYFAVIVQCWLFASLSVATGSSEPKPELSAIEDRSAVDIVERTSAHRRLVAARDASLLMARDFSAHEFLKYNHELHYIDDSTSSFDSDGINPDQVPFAAHVQLASKLPTLLLESADMHFDRITCSDSTVELSFHSYSTLLLAWEELTKHKEMLVITSHSNCNKEGERSPFRVTKSTKTESSIYLAVAPMDWKSAFQSIDVRFDTKAENRQLTAHRRHSKRQASPSSTAAIAATTIEYPPAPTSSPSRTNIIDASIDKQYLETSILPPKFSGLDGVSFHAGVSPPDIKVTCKNCTLQGSVDLSHGFFSMTAGDSDTNSSDIVDFYNDGYVELQVNRFAAHIELETSVQPSTALSYVAPFPDIALPGFSIPNIAVVGPVLRPRLLVGAEIAALLDFQYGFDVSIPNNSSAKLNIKEPTNSTLTGFQKSLVTALPFQSQIENVSLTVHAAFVPQILLTVSVLEGSAHIDAGVFLDLPKVSATIAQASNVNEKCEPANTTGSTKDFIFDSLTHITPTIEADVGVLVDAEIRGGGVNISAAAVQTLWSANYPLPTACFKFDKAAKTYGVPKPSKSGSSSSKSASAAFTKTNPWKSLYDGFGRTGGTLIVLAIVFLTFGKA